MFVTGSAGSFVAGGTGNLACEVAVHFVAVVGFSFVVAVHFVPECLGYFSEIVFDGHCPNPPLIFLQMGQFSPHPHFSAFSAAAALRVASSCSCGSIFMGGLK